MKISARKEKLIESFLSFLQEKGVGANTSRFYTSDLSHFTGWLILNLRSKGVIIESLTESLPFLTQKTASSFKDYLKENGVPARTVNRKLSCLRNLANFLTSTQVLDFDFTEGVANIRLGNQKTLSLDFLKGFKDHLIKEKVSQNTLKNYLADVKQFLAWVDTHQHA